MRDEDARDDERWMRRALRLAALGRETAPNPMVGCVIVDSAGKKVGEGYHARPGEAHAEVNALATAGDRARGATVYVTLEPCSHHGRTAPCADALIAAGVARVVVAMIDPDSRVRGQGIERLRAAGVAVEKGVREGDALWLNRAFVKHRATGLPFVTLKYAMTLDGRIATVTGDSQWITSPATRLWVHRQLRARSPAIMAGIGTVLADDPALTVRLEHRPNARNPLRVIVDSHLRTPIESQAVRLASVDGLTAIAHVDDPRERGDALVGRGVRLLTCPANPGGQVDLRALLAVLGHEMSIIGVLVEGGGELAAGLLQESLVDRVVCAVAPKLVGGRGAPGPIGGKGLARTMRDAVATTGFSVRRSGLDTIMSGQIEPMVY